MAEDCEHRGKVWTEGDTKWECLGCGASEVFRCGHEKTTKQASLGDGWALCDHCKRPVRA